MPLGYFISNLGPCIITYLQREANTTIFYIIYDFYDVLQHWENKKKKKSFVGFVPSLMSHFVPKI